jgi:hypothetical protein
MPRNRRVKFIPSQVWQGRTHSQDGYDRLGDAHNAARRHHLWRKGVVHPQIGWSALYEFTMMGGKWFWREKINTEG